MKRFERLYCTVLSTHRAVVLVTISVLTGLSLWGIWGLGVDADFTALLDSSDETVKTYKQVLGNFAGTDAFVLFIDGNETVGEQTLQQFTAKLQNLKDVAYVQAVPTGNSSSGDKSDDAAAVLIRVKPVFKPTDFSQSRQLSKMIRSLAGQFNLPAGITGSYQVLIESADAANRDMFRAGLVTLAGILVLLLLVFNLPWAVVVCMAVTLCIGLCWTLGLVRLTMGQLNLLTATLPAVMLGLGVDFSLHTIYAFHEKAVLLSSTTPGKRQETRIAFLTYTFSKIYRPLFIGALTTTAAFLSLCFAGSGGLRQMGLMGAFGIGCTFLVATGLLPILLISIPVKTLVNIRRLPGEWFNGFQGISSRARLITVIILILAAGGWSSAHVKFNSDQNKLADQTLPAYALQNKLQAQQGISPVPIAFICPDTQTEKAKLAFLQNLPESPFNLVESFLLAQQQNNDPDRFVGADGTHLILAYPKDNAFKPNVFKKIKSVAEQCEKQFPAKGNLVTGSPLLNAALNQTIKADLLHCSLLAVLFVCAFVFYCFKTVMRTAMAMLPVVLGTLLMVGFMGYMKIDFTIMTIVIVPLVIGAGIDDGVHLLSRWYIENKNVHQTLRSVATPIIGTTLTSMIGFGSLMLSANPGFRQLGLVVMAGLGFCLLISLFILPQMLNLFEGSRRQ